MLPKGVRAKGALRDGVEHDTSSSCQELAREHVVCRPKAGATPGLYQIARPSVPKNVRERLASDQCVDCMAKGPF